jgi:hypothetical protein
MDNLELERLLERHKAFWRGEGEKPLVMVSPYTPLAASEGIPLADGSRTKDGQYITPEIIDPHRFYEGDGDPVSPINGDFIVGTTPPGMCWTEAMVGCPIRVVTGGVWAESFFDDWERIGDLAMDERWLEKLVEFTEFLVQRAEGRYPIGHPLFRGPIDMMAAALGHEEICLAFIERPADAEAFLSICADIFIRAAETRLNLLPQFYGGYLSDFGLWAPGTVLRTQVDNGVLFSPKIYGRQILPQDRRVIERFEYPLIHLHSGCLHIIDHLLEVEALKAIQVSIDYPGGPLATEIMPILGKILQRKSLIVTGPVTERELQELLSLSPPGGLCVQVQVYDR